MSNSEDPQRIEQTPQQTPPAVEGGSLPSNNLSPLAGNEQAARPSDAQSGETDLGKAPKAKAHKKPRKKDEPLFDRASTMKALSYLLFWDSDPALRSKRHARDPKKIFLFPTVLMEKDPAEKNSAISRETFFDQLEEGERQMVENLTALAVTGYRAVHKKNALPLDVPKITEILQEKFAVMMTLTPHAVRNKLGHYAHLAPKVPIADDHLNAWWKKNRNMMLGYRGDMEKVGRETTHMQRGMNRDLRRLLGEKPQGGRPKETFDDVEYETIDPDPAEKTESRRIPPPGGRFR